MGKLGERRRVLPDNPNLLRRNVVTLSHCLPADALAMFVESPTLDPPATRAYSPGREKLGVKDPSHDPLVCKSATHDRFPLMPSWHDPRKARVSVRLPPMIICGIFIFLNGQPSPYGYGNHPFS